MSEPSTSPAPATWHVAPSPHIHAGTTSRQIMIDVLIGLSPLVMASVLLFGWPAMQTLLIVTLSALATEFACESLRGRHTTLTDGSALVTAVILALSLPWSCPWYVGVIGAAVAIALGKTVYGGLGQNLFNPAMVGRAFVMMSFAGAIGAGGYVVAGMTDIVAQATPLTAAKMASDLGKLPGWWPLFIGQHNGSLGETCSLACLLGGAYLLVRRVAAWEIPLAMLGMVAVLSAFFQLLGTTQPAFLTLRFDQHLFTGALLFGAFFIATDPVTSPGTRRGRLVFGAGCGLLVWAIRVFSAYPEGVMFAVLLMNGLVPLINRFTVPVPVGGPVPAPPTAKPSTP